MIIDFDDLHGEFVTHPNQVGNIVDVATADLADVAEAVTSRQNFEERAEFSDAVDRTLIDLADLNGCR